MGEKSIKNLLRGQLTCRGFSLAFASGKIVTLKIADLKASYVNDSLVFVADLEEYVAEFCFYEVEDRIISCKTILTAKGEVKDKIKEISSMQAFYKAEQDALFVAHNFIDVGVLERNKRKKEGVSEDFTAIYPKNQENNAVLFTTKIPKKFYSKVVYKQRKDGVFFSLDTVVPLSFEGRVESEEWFIFVGMPTTTALEWTAKVCGTDKPFEAPIGWSTWDYYFTSATEDDVKEQVDFIASDSVLKEKVKYIALDDGWQQREGDWKSGSRYPSGLKSLVEYINAKGFVAGIWLAPTRLHFLCGTIMRRHEFLMRNELGDPVMDEDMYVLDPTHPDGEKFLRETFAYLNDCGFRFYKLDFISNMLKQERFYDTQAGPFDALEKLFQIARETVAEGSHLMGCSLPYGARVGMADSKRTGLDIHNTYKHVKKCFDMYVFQYAANEKLYRNDLDYLLVRGTDTAVDEQYNVLLPWKGMYANEPTDEFRWRDGEDFSYIEAKTWCSIVLMAGSSVFLGDKLTLLNDKGLELVYKTLKNVDFHAAKPVFSGEEGLVEVWRKEQTGSVYVYNFGEEKKSYEIEISNGEYVDIFTEKRYLVENEKVTLEIDKHDCVCLYKK